MKMQCLCKSISSSSSSCGVPFTSNVYLACRAAGLPKLLSPFQVPSFLHTSPDRRALQVFCSSELNPSFSRLWLHPSFTNKITHHSFTSTRSLQSASKRTSLRNPSPKTVSSPSSKKGKVHAVEDSPAKAKGSPKPVQAQKKNAPKQKQAEAKTSSKPVQAKAPKAVQAKAASTSKVVQAKGATASKQVLKKVVVDEQEDSEEDDDFIEDYDDDDEDFDDDEDLDDELIVDADEEDGDAMDEDDAFIDDMLDEEGEGVEDIVLGDGGDGGGIKISQTPWGEKALAIAKGVLEEFGSNFSLYAFKTSFENRIYVRLDKHSDRYGSPTMVEIESFSSILVKRLEAAGQDGLVPDNLALEVSSPGAERVVLIPDQLTRFKDLPMLVRYEEAPSNENTKCSPSVKDSILELESFEPEAGKSMWKLANVRANREQAGKGRGLTKKQKEWRAEIPLSALRLVRLYMDI